MDHIALFCLSNETRIMYNIIKLLYAILQVFIVLSLLIY